MEHMDLKYNLQYYVLNNRLSRDTESTKEELD